MRGQNWCSHGPEQDEYLCWIERIVDQGKWWQFLLERDATLCI